MVDGHEDRKVSKSLREIQLQELEILKVLDAVFQKNGFRYFLNGGTLLGAMRHDGFIPWDDDIDIGMPMEDYKRFKKMARSILPKELEYIPEKSDKSYLGFAKVFDGELDVDIFPFVRKPNLSSLVVRHLLRSRHGCFWRIRSAKNRSSRFMVVVWYFAHFVAVAVWKFLCVLFPRGGWHICPESGFVEYANEGQFVPFVDHVFEGMRFPVPADADAFLISQYGNWHELPPEAERKPSHM